MNTGMPLPKYHQVYLVLREQLQEGRFDAGLPGELALMAQFGVARVTVRRALAQLSEEGLIERQPGRGTRPVRTVGTKAAGAAVGGRSAPQTARLTGLLENLVSESDPCSQHARRAAVAHHHLGAACHRQRIWPQRSGPKTYPVVAGGVRRESGARGAKHFCPFGRCQPGATFGCGDWLGAPGCAAPDL